MPCFLLWVRSVDGVLGCVRLLRRLRPVESIDFHAFPEDTHDRRYTCSIDVEKLRPEHMRSEADVGESRGISMAEAAGFLFLREVRFQGFQRLCGPVRKPLV